MVRSSSFGFVLLFVGRQSGHLHGNEVAIFTAVAITTIFTSSYLISYNEQIYRFLLPFFRLFGPDKHRQYDEIPENHEVWIIGYHRIGMKVAETMTALKMNFSVIDFDPAAIERVRKAGIPFYFGDIADIEFLEIKLIFIKFKSFAQLVKIKTAAAKRIVRIEFARIRRLMILRAEILLILRHERLAKRLHIRRLLEIRAACTAAIRNLLVCF